MKNMRLMLVAVESYQDTRIRKVRFAENDARGIRKALEVHGLKPSDVTTLLSTEATKNRIESEIRRLCRALTADDTLIFFYAGHGYSDATANFITCHDTVHGDIADTSIGLQYILNTIKSSASKRVVMFFDMCHSGLEIDDSMRGLVSEMTDTELKEFCDNAEHHWAFSSCKSDEKSFSSPQLNHGIWSYSLIEALHGRDKSALLKGKFLTASTLQNFLSAQVAQSAKRLFTPPKSQTPVSWGNLTREFIVADFTDIFANRDAVARAELGTLTGASFVGSESGLIRKLSGFKKTHRVPIAINNATRAFVGDISADEVREKTGEITQSLKRCFGYKLKDLKADIEQGTIETPDFGVTVVVEIDNEDPNRYILITSVDDISSPLAVSSPKFAEVFDNEFDTISFEFTGTLDVRELILRLEEDDVDPSINITYPTSARECTIDFPGFGACVTFTRNGISISFPVVQPIGLLLDSVRQFPALATEHGLLEVIPKIKQ